MTPLDGAEHNAPALSDDVGNQGAEKSNPQQPSTQKSSTENPTQVTENTRPLDTDSLLAQLHNRQQQLEQGLHSLQQLSSISPGCSPYEVVFELEKTRLRYYPAQPQGRIMRPVFIVYALVNRPEILDLQPGRSLIAELTRQGTPVYLLDWGSPDSADCLLDLDDYINHYLDQHFTQALAHSDRQQLDLLGVCQGGTFSLCYTALQPERVRSLITMVTPIDFHTPDNRLALLLKQLDTRLIRHQLSNIPGSALYGAFKSLAPMRQGMLQELNLAARLSTPQQASDFLHTQHWLQHSPDLAAMAFAEFVELFYQQNRLVAGGLMIGNQAVDLQQIIQPVLNLYAAQDHLVPPASSRRLRGLTRSSRYAERRINSGHIGIFIGRKPLQRVPGLITEWLEQEKE